MKELRYLSVSKLAEICEGKIIGDPTQKIVGIHDIEHAGPGFLTFYRDKKYFKALENSQASAVLVPENFETESLKGKKTTLIKVANPMLAFAQITMCFMEPPIHQKGIHQKAHIAASAKVDPTATIFPFVYIGENSTVAPIPSCTPEFMWVTKSVSVMTVCFTPTFPSWMALLLTTKSSCIPVL